MAQLSGGEWRLYWQRVAKSFASLFSDSRRASWADAAAAEARAAAIRLGKGTPRQQAAATQAIKFVTSALRPQLPRGEKAKEHHVRERTAAGPSAFLTDLKARPHLAGAPHMRP